MTPARPACQPDRMPKTLTLDDDTEIRTLQLVMQKGNADLPNLPGLATLTAKIAALSDPEPEALTAPEKK